jgi:hypothetical protein
VSDKQRLISQTQVAGSGSFSDLKEQLNFLVTTSISYVYQQDTPSSEWVIEHNLGRFPKVTILDENKEIINAYVHYDSENQITIKFSEPVRGIALLQYARSYNYVFIQDTPVKEWVIEHNLHRLLEVTVVDDFGTVIHPYIHYDSPDKVTVKFNIPMSGVVYLQ